MSGAAAVAIAPIVFVTDVPAENDLVPVPSEVRSRDREISEPLPLMKLVPKEPLPIPKPTPVSGQAWERARTPSSGIPIRMAKGLRRGTTSSSADESDERTRPQNERDIQWDELTPLMERPERFSEVVPKARRNDERTPRVGQKVRPNVPWPTAPAVDRSAKAKPSNGPAQVPARRADKPQRAPMQPASASKTLVGQHPAPWLLDDNTPVKAPKAAPRSAPPKAVPSAGLRKAMAPPPLATPQRTRKVVEPSSASTRIPPSVRTPLNTAPMAEEITRVGRPTAQRARASSPAKVPARGPHTSRAVTSAPSRGRGEPPASKASPVQGRSNSAQPGAASNRSAAKRPAPRPQPTRPTGQVVSSIPSRTGGTFVGRVLSSEPVSARAISKTGSSPAGPTARTAPARRGPTTDARLSAPLTAVPTKIERPRAVARPQPRGAQPPPLQLTRTTEGSGTRRRPQPSASPQGSLRAPIGKVQTKQVALGATTSRVSEESGVRGTRSRGPITSAGDRGVPRESMVAPKPSRAGQHDPDKTPIQGPPPLPPAVLEELEWERARAAAQRAIDEEEAAWERALAAAKLRHT